MVVFKHPKDIVFIKKLQPIIKVFLKKDGNPTQAVDLVGLEREFHTVCQTQRTLKQELLQATRSFSFKVRKQNETISPASAAANENEMGQHQESISKVIKNHAVRQYLYLKGQTIQFKKFQDWKKVSSKFRTQSVCEDTGPADVIKHRRKHSYQFDVEVGTLDVEQGLLNSTIASHEDSGLVDFDFQLMPVPFQDTSRMRANSATQSTDANNTIETANGNFGEYLNEKTDSFTAVGFLEKYVWVTIKADLQKEVKLAGRIQKRHADKGSYLPETALNSQTLPLQPPPGKIEKHTTDVVFSRTDKQSLIPPVPALDMGAFQASPQKSTYPGSNEELNNNNKTPRRKSTLGLLRSCGSVSSSVDNQNKLKGPFASSESKQFHTTQKSPPITSKEFHAEATHWQAQTLSISPKKDSVIASVFDSVSQTQTSRYMQQLDKTINHAPAHAKVVSVNNRSNMMNVLREKDFLRALASKGDLRTGKSVYENTTSSQANSTIVIDGASRRHTAITNEQATQMSLPNSAANMAELASAGTNSMNHLRSTFQNDYDTFQTNAGDVILFFEGDRDSENAAAVQIVKRGSPEKIRYAPEVRSKTINRTTMDQVKRMNDKHIQRDKAKHRAKRDVWRGKSVHEEVPANMIDNIDFSDLTNQLNAMKVIAPEHKDAGRFSDLKIAGKSPLRRALMQQQFQKTYQRQNFQLDLKHIALTPAGIEQEDSERKEAGTSPGLTRREYITRLHATNVVSLRNKANNSVMTQHTHDSGGANESDGPDPAAVIKVLGTQKVIFAPAKGSPRGHESPAFAHHEFKMDVSEIDGISTKKLADANTKTYQVRRGTSDAIVSKQTSKKNLSNTNKSNNHQAIRIDSKGLAGEQLLSERQDLVTIKSPSSHFISVRPESRSALDSGYDRRIQIKIFQDLDDVMKGKKPLGMNAPSDTHTPKELNTGFLLQSLDTPDHIPSAVNFTAMAGNNFTAAMAGMEEYQPDSPVITLTQICTRKSNAQMRTSKPDSKYGRSRGHTPIMPGRSGLTQVRLPTGDMPGGRRSNMNKDIAEDLVCTPTVTKNEHMNSRFPDSLLSSVHAINNTLRTNPSTPGRREQRKIQKMQVEITSPPTNCMQRGPIYATMQSKMRSPDFQTIRPEMFTIAQRETIQLQDLANMEKSTPNSHYNRKSRVTDSYEFREKTLISRLLYNAAEIAQPPTTGQPQLHKHITPSSAEGTNKMTMPMSGHSKVSQGLAERMSNMTMGKTRGANTPRQAEEESIEYKQTMFKLPEMQLRTISVEPRSQQKIAFRQTIRSRNAGTANSLGDTAARHKRIIQFNRTKAGLGPMRLNSREDAQKNSATMKVPYLCSKL